MPKRSQIIHILLFSTIFFGAVAIFSYPPVTAASSYYVSPSGSDSNSGTIGSPWLTLSYSATKLAAGDTLYIRGGTYHEKVKFTISGTSSQPIKILAYPGETPVLDGQYTLPAASPTYSQLLTFSGSYIQSDGMEIKNSYWAGVEISGAHVTLSHFNSHDNLEAGIIAYGSSDATVTDSAIYGNDKSYENGVYNYPGRTSHATGLTAGPGSTRSVFLRNQVYHNWGEGLDLYESTDNTVADNVIYDNSKNVYISDTTGDLVQRNLVYCTPSNTYRLSASPKQHGINLQDEKQTPASANITIINNLVVGCVTNFKWYPYASNSSMNGIVVANNTFVNATSGSEAAFVIASPTNITHSNTSITNNIILQEDTQAIGSFGSPTTGITFSNNLWSKSPPSSMTGTNSIVANPLITKSGSFTPGNLTGAYFKFSSSSPAINKAATLAAVTRDYFGTTRPSGSAPDIGAYEYIFATSSGTSSPAASPTASAGTGTSSSSGGTSSASPTPSAGTPTSISSTNDKTNAKAASATNPLSAAGNAAGNVMAKVRSFGALGWLAAILVLAALGGVAFWVYRRKKSKSVAISPQDVSASNATANATTTTPGDVSD